MTNLRVTSINITLEALSKAGVLNPQAFMTRNRAELIETMKEAEATDRWSLIPAKVKELLEV